MANTKYYTTQKKESFSSIGMEEMNGLHFPPMKCSSQNLRAPNRSPPLARGIPNRF